MYSAGRFLSTLLIVYVVLGRGVLSDEKKVCVDVSTNKTYQLKESWNVPNQCIKYSCTETAVPGLPNVTLPTMVKYICSEPKSPDNDMRNCHAVVPYPKAPYPKCCTHLICNRPGFQQVIKPQY